MSLRLQIVVGVVIVLTLIGIFRQVHSNHLNLRYALIWILVGTVVFIFDICPTLLVGLTKLLGMELPVNMLFFLGFIFALGILFVLTTKVSRQSDEIKRLTQELALMEHQLDALKRDKSED